MSKPNRKALEWIASNNLKTADDWFGWYNNLSEGALPGISRRAVIMALFNRIRVESKRPSKEARRELRRIVRMYYLISVGLVHQRGDSVKLWLSGEYSDANTATSDPGSGVLHLAIRMARNERDIQRRGECSAHCSHYYWKAFRAACKRWLRAANSQKRLASVTR